MFVPRWLAIVVVLLLVGGLGFAIGWVATPDDSSSASSAAERRSAPSGGTTPNQGTTPPSTTTPPASTDPSAAALRNLGLRQSDVGPTVSVVADSPRQQRDQRGHVGSLQRDLSRANRNARRASRSPRIDAQSNVALSTESVLYSNAAATEQAFTELEQAAADCPSTPVASPIDEDTSTTKFNAAPDGAWPEVAGVERRAFDFTTTDDTGQAQRSVAVYLRRGRALMGIYFPQPDSAQTPVAGQTTIAGIVNVFAERLAELPDSVVN